MIKAVIWGTGEKASFVTKNIINADIVAYVESVPNKKKYNDINVIKPSELISIKYDIIIISMRHPVDAWQLANTTGIKNVVCIYLDDFKCMDDIMENYNNLTSFKQIFTDRLFNESTSYYSDILPQIMEFEDNSSFFDV